MCVQAGSINPGTWGNTSLPEAEVAVQPSSSHEHDRSSEAENPNQKTSPKQPSALIARLAEKRNLVWTQTSHR